MSIGGSSQPRPSRNDRREAAREKARILREEQKKRDRRKKILIQAGVVVAVVAVAALIVGIVLQNTRPEGPGPRNMASDGIVLSGADGAITAAPTPALQPGADPVATVQDDSGDVANIVTYVDYLCPYCGQFERTNADTLQTLVQSGAATLEIHPIAILTNKSAGTQYSLRAANAAACVADVSPDSFFDFNTLLFQDGVQPEEGSKGLSNDELKELAKQAGVSDAAKVGSCIDQTQFKEWVLASTARALSGPLPNSEIQNVQGTPTVLVNGKSYGGSLTDPEEFQAFLTQAASESSLDATPTPTPTPAPAQ